MVSSQMGIERWCRQRRVGEWVEKDLFFRTEYPLTVECDVGSLDAFALARRVGDRIMEL